MRILVATTEAFGGHGGIACYNRDLLTALAHYPGCREVIAFPRLPTPGMPEGIPSGIVYQLPGSGSVARYAGALTRACLSSDIDLIVCGHINLLPIVYPLARLRRVPLLLVIYGIDVWKPTGRLLANQLAPRVDATISISQITADRFGEWTGLPSEKISVLPNAVHLDQYGPGPKNEALVRRYGLEGRRVLMTLGRLSADEKYKGIDEVMQVLPELRGEDPSLAYLIVGDGTDRTRLEQKARDLGVFEAVRFAGRISESEKTDHYRLADAFAMPGRGEGFGFVFLEAMACGIPVVASRLDGSREAVRHGKLGIMVDPDDARELKEGLRAALAKPKGIVPEGLEFFSFANFEHRCRAFLDRLLHGRPLAPEKEAA